MLRPLFGDSFGRGLNSASVEAASLAASATFVPARRRRQLCAAASLRRRRQSAPPPASLSAAARGPPPASVPRFDLLGRLQGSAPGRAPTWTGPSARQVDLPFPKPPAKFADAQKRHLWSLNPRGGTSWAPSREPAVGADACGGSRPHGAATRTRAGTSRLAGMGGLRDAATLHALLGIARE
jgi:hypothetical protein